MAPPSQKYRSIGFFLSGGPGADANFTFAIRPEELSRQESSRLTVQQTLGGAWADSFGASVSTITLSGHNGWRGGFLSSGEDAFQSLRTTVFQGWHDRRDQAINAGSDPSDVTLHFTDSLDSISALVAPRSFALRRSKSSPLLIRYNIQLLVLGDASEGGGLLDDIVSALSNPLRWLASVTGLTNVVSFISNAMTQATNAFGAITSAVTGFINTGLGLIQSVTSIAETVQGQFDAVTGPILSVGTAYCQAASNAFQALADDPTLPASQRLYVMQIASGFNDAACCMSNGFNIAQFFADYSALFGASTCSSTAGGDPPSTYTVAGANPFADVFPPGSPPVSITPSASAAIATLRGDPLLMVGQQATLGSLMSTASGGVKVAS